MELLSDLCRSSTARGQPQALHRLLRVLLAGRLHDGVLFSKLLTWQGRLNREYRYRLKSRGSLWKLSEGHNTFRKGVQGTELGVFVV